MRGLFFFIIFSVSGFCQIEELDRFSNLEKHLTKDTLLILDIDDTLLIPVQMLGSDEWFCYRLKEKEQRCNSKEALEKTLAEWEAIRHLSQMQIVEPGTEVIITSLQKRGFQIMAMTTQGLALATRTYQQLLQNGFELSSSSPMKGDCFLLVGDHGVLYRKGILFTSGTSKGVALFTLFKQMGFEPKRLVFVNDKESHLKDVEQEAKKMGIEFLGLRYAYADQHKALFSPEVAEYQYNHSSFGKILSNEEAQLAMNKK